MKDCYSVTQYSVQQILGLITSGDIAIPEIQRPFVWDSTKVRELVDSLYKGYPTGYLIAWKNPDVRLKGGATRHLVKAYALDAEVAASVASGVYAGCADLLGLKLKEASTVKRARLGNTLRSTTAIGSKGAS